MPSRCVQAAECPSENEYIIGSKDDDFANMASESVAVECSICA